MVHQKAVWMLFEDWLEYKTSSSASPESLLSGVFSLLQQQLHTYNNFASGLFCFVLFSSSSHIVIIVTRPDELF